MIKGKMAGIAFGGLAGFLVINRVFNLIENSVKSVCDASKWKYYKYGKDGTMVAPGYSMHTHKINDEHEVVVEDENQTKQNDAQKPQEPSAMDVINKAVDKIFGDEKKPEEASEEPEKDDNEPSVDCDEIENPLYVESLENGVELKGEDTDGDDIFNVEIDSEETEE